MVCLSCHVFRFVDTVYICDCRGTNENDITASTGNVCTIRCFNAATAGPFGGCFAVQQTDETASANTPGTIATAQTLEGVEAQVLQYV